MIDAGEMLHYLRVIDWPEPELRRFACWCVRFTPVTPGRTVWDLLPCEVFRKGVKQAEQYARGFIGRPSLARAKRRIDAKFRELPRDLGTPSRNAVAAARATLSLDDVLRSVPRLCQHAAEAVLYESLTPRDFGAALRAQARRLAEDESFLHALAVWNLKLSAGDPS